MIPRRHAAPLVLVATEIVAAAMGLAFHVAGRPRVTAAYQEYGTEIPLATRLALAPWLVPGAILVAAALTAWALFARPRASRRLRLLAAGVVLLAFTLSFALLAAYVPLFRAAR